MRQGAEGILTPMFSLPIPLEGMGRENMDGRQKSPHYCALFVSFKELGTRKTISEFSAEVLYQRLDKWPVVGFCAFLCASGGEVNERTVPSCYLHG